MALTALPPEVIFLILTTAKPEHIIRIQEVSKLFAAICDDRMWKRWTLTQYGEMSLPKKFKGWKELYIFLSQDANITVILFLHHVKYTYSEAFNYKTPLASIRELCDDKILCYGIYRDRSQYDAIALGEEYPRLLNTEEDWHHAYIDGIYEIHLFPKSEIEFGGFIEVDLLSGGKSYYRYTKETTILYVENYLCTLFLFHTMSGLYIQRLGILLYRKNILTEIMGASPRDKFVDLLRRESLRPNDQGFYPILRCVVCRHLT